MAAKKSPTKATGEKAAPSATQAPVQDATTLLKTDHRKVEGLFAQYESAVSSEEKTKIARQVCKELIVHTKLEEEIFYPACREKDVQDDMLDEAQVEHDGAKVMIAELIAGEPDDEYYDAKFKVLSEYIKHHVGEEEKPRDGIFAKAQSSGVDMNALGQKLLQRKQELVDETDENDLDPPQPRSLNPQNLQAQETSQMARNSDDRDRDERGRFTNDDDDRRGGSSSRGGYSSRSRDEDDDRRGGSSFRGDQDRDDRGRFMSDDDRGSRGSSSRGRNDDDDRGGYSSRGGNGDRDERGRFTGDDNNGRGSYSSRGGNQDRDDRGRFTGDDGGRGSRGGSSSRGRDDDDRYSGRNDSGGRSGGDSGRGGWFGDSEGHSQAAERGWESRSSSRGGSSRSRDDDDDRRGGRSSSGGSGGGTSRSRDEGHGGWFGDTRGHAEAARRGWQNRD